MSGFLALADGTIFRGTSVGAYGVAAGEAVFTTGMSGYQEAVTDPSFEDQLVCFTAPMVGNYGVAPDRDESSRTHARAVLMREARGPAWTDWLAERGVVALTGIDTRSLVLKLRDAGSMLAAAVADATPVEEAVALAARQPSMAGRALVAGVSADEPSVFRAKGRVRVAVVDYGVKNSVLRRLARAGAAVTVYPHDADADELAGYDGVLLSPGPGDPEPLVAETKVVGDLVGRTNVMGICLGHQLLALATGHETFKLPFGHRGANHPVLERRRRARARDESRTTASPCVRARRPRRATSRSTTRPSRGSSSRSCARARSSSIPRPARGRTTRGRCSRGGWTSLPRRSDLDSILHRRLRPDRDRPGGEFDYSGRQALKVLREEGYGGRSSTRTRRRS
jgi:carbamoyl-phosphate synthase small subunit